MRYIITRPCLQEGSLRLLKYLEDTFPQSGPAIFVDDKGAEHTVQVDTERRRVWGLGGMYHAQHLGVNDVLIITNLAPARYQVEAIVKPHAPPAAPRREEARAAETRRVVVNSTAHVREVRTRELPAEPQTAPAEPQGAEHHVSEQPVAENRMPENRVVGPRLSAPAVTPAAGSPEARITEHRPASPRPAPAQPAPMPVTASARTTEVPRAPEQPRVVAEKAVPVPIPRPAAIPEGAAQENGAQEARAQLAELARLTGYRLEQLGGVVRLSAELGAHGYSVLVALDDDARRSPDWKETADYRVLLTTETERPQGVSRLTREALAALIEHAHLAPLSAVDLRGYWKAGNVDLDSAASVAELVSAHLAQRGAFSFVLLTLAQQPAHTVISVPRLAERLGSGVNLAELSSILETLSRAPFLALTPLPGGQYLLRVGMGELLADLAEYAEGVGRRVRVPARDKMLV
ncbi:hypothetical protein [Deinococcus aerophilus]|uniref:Uncharacterized protein n=1 Tax=Deinococcus aerophilus TaxID=522488 RepID=A0ABQ2GX11_9DEIO|nr:hypothetical protein [Deinococcus aerophilus]GGM17945.1 hypothetical protein GCM10010841_27640 [Deinococcus aerophilus]